jgi:hypothetical protein
MPLHTAIGFASIIHQGQCRNRPTKLTKLICSIATILSLVSPKGRTSGLAAPINRSSTPLPEQGCASPAIGAAKREHSGRSQRCRPGARSLDRRAWRLDARLRRLVGLAQVAWSRANSPTHADMSERGQHDGDASSCRAGCWARPLNAEWPRHLSRCPRRRLGERYHIAGPRVGQGSVRDAQARVVQRLAGGSGMTRWRSR